jgi:hypothetical protein
VYGNITVVIEEEIGFVVAAGQRFRLGFVHLIYPVHIFNSFKRKFRSTQDTIDVIVKSVPEKKQIGFIETGPRQLIATCSHIRRRQLLGVAGRQHQVARF